MKKHIEIDQLAELSGSEILTLSNKVWIDSVWAGWDKPEQIEDAVKIYKDKGWRHSSLLATSRACDAATMMELIKEQGSIEVQYGIFSGNPYWEVFFNYPENRGELQYSFVGRERELVDALWHVYKRVLQKEIAG